jgi:hypothetical protein
MDHFRNWVILITHESVEHALRIVGFESVMVSWSPQTTLCPPGDCLPENTTPTLQEVKREFSKTRAISSRTRSNRAPCGGPDRGALLRGGGGSVGRPDEGDDRLAEGVREALRDDVGAAGVDGGDGVAVLRPYRRPLKQNR